MSLISDEKPKLLSRMERKIRKLEGKSTATVDPKKICQKVTSNLYTHLLLSIGEPIRLKASQINMDEVWQLIDKKSLFKLSWGLRGKAGSESQEHEHEQLFKEWKKNQFKKNYLNLK